MKARDERVEKLSQKISQMELREIMELPVSAWSAVKAICRIHPELCLFIEKGGDYVSIKKRDPEEKIGGTAE